MFSLSFTTHDPFETSIATGRGTSIIRHLGRHGIKGFPKCAIDVVVADKDLHWICILS